MPVYSEDEELEIFLVRIFIDRKLDFRGYRRKYLKRRIAVRMRANKVSTYFEYLKVLTSNPSEYESLFEALTINVSEFFRNPEMFKVIKGVILPELIRYKRQTGSRQIRIWSAGCAGGEEPFSIAILLKEMLKEGIDKFTVNIYGTDIDKESLKRAECGEYLPESLKEVDNHLLRKCFISVGEKFRLKDEVRNLVKFQNHNLASDKPLSRMDLILCRNVIIYFGGDLQEKLLIDFYNALNWGGFLTLGKVETLSGRAGSLFKAINIKERIFQKSEIDNSTQK